MCLLKEIKQRIISVEKGKKSVLTHGNLKSKRTFVDIYDAMEAYWLAATKGKIGEIYKAEIIKNKPVR